MDFWFHNIIRFHFLYCHFVGFGGEKAKALLSLTIFIQSLFLMGIYFSSGVSLLNLSKLLDSSHNTPERVYARFSYLPPSVPSAKYKESAMEFRVLFERRRLGSLKNRKIWACGGGRI